MLGRQAPTATSTAVCVKSGGPDIRCPRWQTRSLALICGIAVRGHEKVLASQERFGHRAISLIGHRPRQRYVPVSPPANFTQPQAFRQNSQNRNMPGLHDLRNHRG